MRIYDTVTITKNELGIHTKVGSMSPALIYLDFSTSFLIPKFADPFSGKI
jgi:hypothetical protein